MTVKVFVRYSSGYMSNEDYHDLERWLAEHLTNEDLVIANDSLSMCKISILFHRDEDALAFMLRFPLGKDTIYVQP